MTKDELIENLGTIAYSNTKKILNDLNNNENDLIGQFGVGFYSCFLVSKQVKFFSRKDGQSNMDFDDTTNNFTVEESDIDFPFDHGSLIELVIKPCDEGFLLDDVLKYLIKNIVCSLKSQYI